MTTHHLALIVAYGAALLGWLILARLVPSLWPSPSVSSFSHPKRELAWAIGAIVTTIAIGQLYSRGWLLPATSRTRPALDVFNQLLIYSPFLALPLVRRQPLSTAWLPLREIPWRIAAGLGLAIVAVVAYGLAHADAPPVVAALRQVYDPRHVSYWVQVLLEDVSIAVLFVRVRAAIGFRFSLVLTALLFAAAHIPGLLTSGASQAELLALFGDVALGLGALAVLQRSADVWWFWCVHFAMDMTQFYR